MNEDKELDDIETQTEIELDVLSARLTQAKELVIEAILIHVRLWNELHPESGGYGPALESVIYLDPIKSISVSGHVTYASHTAGLRVNLIDAPIESLVAMMVHFKG